MPSTEQIKQLLDALGAYQQDQQTLQPVINTAQAIYGQDWTAVLTNELETVQGIDPATLNTLKEKANHAIHYYGALAAWEESHQYLTAIEQVDPALLEERLPTLEYWLALFGEEGNNIVAKLRQLLTNISPTVLGAAQPIETPAPVQEEQIVDVTAVEQSPAQEDIPTPTQVENTQEQPVTDMTAFQAQETQLDMGQPLVSETLDALDRLQSGTLQTQEDMVVYPKSISEDTVLTEEDILDSPASESEPAPMAQEIMSTVEDEIPAAEPMLSTAEDEIPAPVDETPVVLEETPPISEEIIAEEVISDETEGQETPEQTIVYTETAEQETFVAQEPQPEPVAEIPVAEAYTPVSDVLDEQPIIPVQEAISTKITQEEIEETPKNWEIANYLKEKALYEQVVAWATAKCIRMGNIELTAYPHYGFIVDMMRSLKDDVQNLLGNQMLAEVIEQQLKNGKKELEDFLKVIETELAHLPEIESQPTENIIDGVDARSILGQLDTSNTKEYLGPAPDGFELMDDPYNKDDDLSKENLLKAYEKAEAEMTGSIDRLNILEEENPQPTEPTSTSQKG